ELVGGGGAVLWRGASGAVGLAGESVYVDQGDRRRGVSGGGAGGVVGGVGVGVAAGAVGGAGAGVAVPGGDGCGVGVGSGASGAVLLPVHPSAVEELAGAGGGDHPVVRGGGVAAPVGVCVGQCGLAAGGGGAGSPGGGDDGGVHGVSVRPVQGP